MPDATYAGMNYQINPNTLNPSYELIYILFSRHTYTDNKNFSLYYLCIFEHTERSYYVFGKVLDVMNIPFDKYYQLLPLNDKEVDLHLSQTSAKTKLQLPTNIKSKRIYLDQCLSTSTENPKISDWYPITHKLFVYTANIQHQIDVVTTKQPQKTIKF